MMVKILLILETQKVLKWKSKGLFIDTEILEAHLSILQAFRRYMQKPLKQNMYTNLGSPHCLYPHVPLTWAMACRCILQSGPWAFKSFELPMKWLRGVFLWTRRRFPLLQSTDSRLPPIVTGSSGEGDRLLHKKHNAGPLYLLNW